MRKSATPSVWRCSDASPLDDHAHGVLVVLAMSEWKSEQIERDRRYLVRKTMDAAENRIRTRTAKEQMAQAMADANRGPSEAIPDADDSAANRAGVLT